jgi:hypothetical protein
MSRLFDAGSQASSDASRQDMRRRAKEAEAAQLEVKELDAAGAELQSRLKDARSVAPIVYKSFRSPGGKWNVEHAVDGQDYVYQVIPLKPTRLVTPDILTLMIQSMDAIFPRTVQISYRPPSDQFSIKYFTVRVAKVVGLPGWKAAVERALHELAVVPAW